MIFKSKLPNVGTSIFAIMTEMSNRYNAINLSQGFPDFEVNPELIELVHYYMNKGFNQYAPMPGIFDLRKNITEKISKLYNHLYNPETEITITAGATQALYTAISVLVENDDEVIMFEPVYDSYAPAVITHGGKPVFIKLNTDDFSIFWDEVEKRITKKTKAIILNSPHNPTGKVITKDDLNSLEKILKENDI